MKFITLLCLLFLVLPAQAKDLYIEVGHPGETMDAFIYRIAPKAIRTSKMLKAEVCGEIIDHGTNFQLNIHTDFNAHHCWVGVTTSKFTFHTHVTHQHAFSPDDYGRPGYMATGKRLVLKQSGPGTQHRILAPN